MRFDSPWCPMKKEPSPQIEIRRILVLRAGAVGDLILTLPALRALRTAFPRAYLEVMGHPHTLTLIEGQGVADAISSIHRSEAAYLYVPNGPIPKELRRTFGAFDLIVAYAVDEEGTLPDNLRRTGAKRVISWPPFPSLCSRHEVDHLLDALKPAGIACPENVPKLFPSPSDRAFAERFWRTHTLHLSDTVLALHPGSGSPSKCWAPERFARIADWATEVYRAAILLIAGPADGDAVRRTLRRMKRTPILASHQTLPHLAAILQRCTTFLGNDSGVTHLAAAVSVPTVALFGPTDPRIWGPRGDHVTILRCETPCAPCDDRDRRACPHRICLEHITIEDVQAALSAPWDAFGSRKNAPESGEAHF